MEKQVVFFGAGASYGAREPRPSLGKDLHQWVLQYLNKKIKLDWDFLEADGDIQIIQYLKNKLKVADSFEALAQNLWEGNERAKLFKLNFLLAASMTPPFNKNNPHEEPRVNDSFVEKLDVYDEWLKSCVKKADHLKNFTFITLNYDCLLERAICRTFFTCDQEEGQCQQCLCTHVRYPFIGGPTTGVEVLKLHGSINWIGDSWGEPGKNGISLPIFLDGSKKISTYKNIKLISTCMGRDFDELVLATYAPGKHPQANLQLFKDIKKRAIEKIAESQKIEIIGVHIPPNEQDDPTLWELFQLMDGKNVTFINPSEKENKLAKSTFGFNFKNHSFKGYVATQT
jgi:hypothetical protein